MKEAKNPVGLKIREIRKAKNLTQEKLAESADVNQRHIVRIETAEGEPSLTTLKKIAKALDVDIDILLKPEGLTKKDLIRLEIDDLLNKFDQKELSSVKTILLALLEIKPDHSD